MSILISIPSRGRSNLSMSTLRWIPKTLRGGTVVFTHSTEWKKYKDAIFNYSFDPVICVPLEYTYIGEKREKIAQWAQEQGYDKIAMLDDDISQFAVRIEEGKTPLRISSDQDRIEMFQTVEDYLEHYAHVGVSARFHNDAFVGQDPVVVENARMIRFLAYRVEEFLACEHGRVQVCEDFDITLQLLNKGFKNGVLFKWSQDQRETGQPGGCSLYRTLELHNANITKLHELWPDVTRIRVKKSKSGGDLATRNELVIDWSTAYKPSPENNIRKAME